jgi:tetratricopeptide (TPR) repeat protein
MFREDYLIRLIRQFGEEWRIIVELLKRRLFPSAEARIEQAFEQLLGLPRAAIRESTANELIARLRFGEEPALGREKCVVLVSLLKAAGDVAGNKDDLEQQANEYHKALLILLDTLLRDPDYILPDGLPTIEELVALLHTETLGMGTRSLLLRYYEQRGAFAKAEDTLFTMLEDAPGSPIVAEVGRAFYTRLQAHSDDALAAGNLPRDEVDAGRRTFETRIHLQDEDET